MCIPANRSSAIVLQTEIIPYMSVINTTLHDTGKAIDCLLLLPFQENYLGLFFSRTLGLKKNQL